MNTDFFMNKKNILIAFFSILTSISTSFSQKSEKIIIEWQEPQEIEYFGKTYVVPSIKNQQLDGNAPNFYWTKNIPNNNLELQITNVITGKAYESEKRYLESQNINIQDLKYNIAVTQSKNEYVAVLDLIPFVRRNNEIVRVVSFELNYLKKSNTGKKLNKDFVANSVLAPGSGEWYKISVDVDGVYKIDKSFLENCGIDVENINPQWINIYGNGDGRLPELNSAYRTDDLALNSISIIGESDGIFDDEDYILFYGWGPDRWYEDVDSTFYQDKHIYSDVSTYFININSSNLPSRIGTITSSTMPVTHNVNSYTYFDIHESDVVSLVNGGQRWYGELFDTQLDRSFPFVVPDIDPTVDAKFKVSLASNAKLAGGTEQKYSVNGVQIYSSSLPTSSEFGRSELSMKTSSPSSSIPLRIQITRNSPDILTYLDKITLNARRQLKFINSSSQLSFRDPYSVGVGNVGDFTITNFPASNGFVWEVTDRKNPKIVSGVLAGSVYSFQADLDSLREYVASDGQVFLTPKKIGEVFNQNLHALPQADYLIVTNKAFVGQADRLADLHRANGLTVHVVNTDEIFNEFSSGMKDATAIRSFVKMFWDRGALLPSTRPKYLLLFGDGTFDPKNRVANNNNYILTYQVLNSENHIAAMPSDDYFGILDDSESMLSVDQVDIGVGRLLISDLVTAKEQVDKIEHYMRNGSSLYNTSQTNCSSNNGSTTFGDWRTKYVQIADDEEGNYFLNFDVEKHFEYVTDSFPEMNCEKIYLDAYQQVSTAGGQRYPEVNAAIDNKIERGALVVNYVGHGGEVGLAEERIITVPQIQDWRNIDVLPLFVSATCEFTKFDDPDRVSAGEWASLNPYGAAIALMTTTRSVYFGTNTQIGREFYKNVFRRDSNFEPLEFGEIIRVTKNAVGGDNKRSFTLIGDPALKIALPRLKVVTDSINGLDSSVEIDTLSALSLVKIKGHLEDHMGNQLNSFNGIVYPSVFDKPKEQKTLSNDGVLSPEMSFYTQTNKVYSGKASVVNGFFEFSFVVPKDINYSIDFGKISYYAENGITDAIGFDTMFYIGGINPNGLNDNTGPDIELFLNNESFVNGGVSDETPILIAKLFDENGINTVGNGIGHDITAILDGETGNPVILNDFYSADLDSYQSGEIRYNYAEIPEGEHTLTLKVWDVNNNSSEATINFVVQDKIELELRHVLNYPNPFTTSTDFYFEHNQACSQLETQIQIFTVSGKLVRTINEYVHSEGFRSSGIHWDGRDDFGDQLAKGVYVYRLKVKTPEGSLAEKLEKLVILK